MELLERILVLAEIPFFTDCTLNQLTNIALASYSRNYLPGHMIARRGDAAKRVYLVTRGKILKDQGLPAGDIVGWREALSGMAMTSDLIAGPEGADCIVFGKGPFISILRRAPSIAIALMEKADREVKCRENGNIYE